MFVTVLAISIGIPAAKASSTDMNSDKDPTLNTHDVEKAFSLAQDILTNYYQVTDIGTEEFAGKSFDTSLLDSELSKYVEQKIKTKQYVTKAGDAEKENYTLKFTVLSSEVTKEGVFLSISTEAAFNYVGLKVESGFGEISNMFFKDTGEGFTLTDWYMPYQYYDEFVRGVVDNSSQLFPNSISADSNFSTLADSNFSMLQEELHDNVVKNLFSTDQLAPEQETDSAEESTHETPSVSATLRSLNKKNIVTWARNNMVVNPKSGNGVVPYYDFSKINNAWDCTNFVSHALLAGGAVVYDTGGTGISSTGWYYRSTSNRSSSWTGVPNLHAFLTGNRTKGPAGTSITYRTFDWFGTRPYEAGDVMQFYLSGSYNNWRHSTIITEFYEVGSTPNHVGALVTGRSAAGSYNNNQKAHTIYEGDAKRVIKLSGYYN